MWSLLLFFSAVFLLIKWHNSTSQQTSKNLPPSPPRLPLIGNLHQLRGKLLHEAFLSLAKRYGDQDGLVLAYVGTIPCLVVSTTEAACEILKTNDITFADRPLTRTFTSLTYNLKDVVFSPYGEHWRQLKSILTLNLLSNKMVQTLEPMMKKRLECSLSEIKQCFLANKHVNLMSLTYSLSNDITCMSLFGRHYNEGEIARQFKNIIKDVSEILGSFYFEDFIPQLAVVDIARGIRSKEKRVNKSMDEFLTGAVAEWLSSSANPDPAADQYGFTPFIEALLKIQKEDSVGITIDSDAIKALLLNAYIAATDTTAVVIQWAMTEFLIKPDILKKAQEEVRTVLNGNKDITSEDLEKMTYLKAVIMETTRFHPPLPILFPRSARHDANIMGYDIAKGTRVYVNVYAIMRDPKVWKEPNKFMPERFLDTSTDFVRHNFEILPFGAGRRGCPGRVYSMAAIQMTLAAFLYEFDWSLPPGVRPGDVDLEGTFGTACHKKIPLLAIGKPVH